jgi:hypothetical protein
MKYLKNSIPTLSFLLLIVSVSSCNFFVENGGLGASLNIKEAKKRGVFVRQYLPIENPYKINDSLTINVKSAWLEHLWRYAGSNSESADIEKDGYQLIIVADEHSLNGFNNKWLIGVTSDSTFYGGFQNAIITSFKELPKADTLRWQVESGNQLAKSIPKTIIGKFSLVAVK